jgi:hypothetical protein
MFNFLKQKKGSIEKQADISDSKTISSIEKQEETQESRKNDLFLRLEHTKTHAEQMRASGRDEDAKKEVVALLKEALEEWKKDIHNTKNVRVFTTFAITFHELNIAMLTLRMMIDRNEKEPVFDSTIPYIELGRIYHERKNPAEELASYMCAIDAVTPIGCRFPATKSDKALAHNLAYLFTSRVGNKAYMKLHDDRRRELLPELDWDDPIKIENWVNKN